MYRAYQPSLPATNLYLKEKWDKCRYEEHRRKVSRAVPVVNTKGSPIPFHLIVNMKKVQMKKDLEILREKENCIHSAKMNAIRQSHGRLDNWNYYPQRSLTIGQRRQDMSRITQDNSKMLERILKRQSEYGKWVSEWEKLEQIRTNISRYQRPTGSAVVGWQKATLMVLRRNMDIQHLAEGSETDITHMGSTVKLENISKAARHRRMKGSSVLTDKKSRSVSVQTEPSTDTPSWESSKCDTGQRSDCSSHKRRASNTATSKKTDHTHQVRCKSRSHELSNSESDWNNFRDVSTGRKSLLKQELDEKSEQNSVKESPCHDHNHNKTESEEICGKATVALNKYVDGEKSEQNSVKESPSCHDHNHDKMESEEICGKATVASNKYVDSEVFDSDSERKTPLLYSKSGQDFSSEKSASSSCYSLQDSDDNFSLASSQSSELIETLSNLSLNLKTRAVSPRTTSQKKSKSSVASVTQLQNPHSTSQNVSRNSNLSSEVSKRSHYELPESTNTNTSPSSSAQMTNRSVDSTSLVTNRMDVFSLQGASMRAFSRSSASSSTYGQGSSIDTTQSTYGNYEQNTRDSSQTPDTSTKTSTGRNDSL